MFDFKKQEKLNLKHRDAPQAGDYWSERMFLPIFLIIEVCRFGIIILEETKYINGGFLTWDVEKVSVLSLKKFSKKVSYTSMDKTWCDVTPNSKDWELFAKKAFQIRQNAKQL